MESIAILSSLFCWNIELIGEIILVHNFQIHSQTINGKYTMMQAKKEHAEDIMELLGEVAKWLKSQGSDQWSGLLEGKDSHNTTACIDRGEVFICLDGEHIAGMVILMQQPSEWDRKLWEKNAYQNDGAIYLHRLAISRQYANSGLGKTILDWCESGVLFQDKYLIRLDCVGKNLSLNQFYQVNGYSYKGEKKGYSLYEKTIEQ